MHNVDIGTRIPSQRWPRGVAAAVLFAIVAACSGGGDDAPDPAAAPTPVPSPAPAPAPPAAPAPAPAPTPSAVRVQVTPAIATLSTLQTQSFVATVANAADTAVTWRVDGVVGGNATTGTISADGVYTPSRRVASHRITATSVQDPTRGADATAEVGPLRGVLTYHNDNSRTGQNLRETVLTPRNVGTAGFGKLATLPVDGAVYAAPLLVAGVPIDGLRRDIVIVATEHNSVYAFDADGRSTTALWQLSFSDPLRGITPVPSVDTDCPDITPEIGITSTPVIDPLSGTLYVVAMGKENGVHTHRLHAIDITTGKPLLAGGRLIQAAVPGMSTPDDGTGLMRLDSLRANQRAALLLNNGTVYIGFGAFCNVANDNGWLLAYDAKTLQQRAAFSTSPRNKEAGIWQSGGGPAADAAGDVFAVTGDGTFDAASGGSSYGNTVLKLAGAGLAVRDHFTPFNQLELDQNNGDLGSGGVLLLPDQAVGPRRLAVSVGKQGTMYLLNRDNLGGFQAGSDSQIVQSFPVGACGAGSCGVFGTAAWFNGMVYVAPSGDALKAFALSAGRLTLARQSTSLFRWPGATVAISANGSADGIVWTIESNGSGAPAVLRAHDAANVSVELYSSQRQPLRDVPGGAVKFSVPTVAEGRVYMGTQNALVVYGMLP